MLDEIGEVGNLMVGWCMEPIAEIVPEEDAELAAGLGEAEEGVAAIASGVAAGAAADFALGDVASDVAFGSVGVKGDLRAVEDEEQLGLVGMETSEQAVEGDKAGAALEDTVEAGAQRRLAPRRWVGLVGLEVAIEPPDEAAHALLRGALEVGEGVELVDEALGMHPAQAMLPDVELSGVVADNRRAGQKTVRRNAAPESAFGGDADRVVLDLERDDAEAVQVRLPSPAVGKAGRGMAGKPGDSRSGEMARAHIGQRFGVDDVIPVPGTQQLEKVQPALRAGRCEPGEMGIAHLGAEAVHRLVARHGIVHRDPGGTRQPGAQHLARLAEEAVLPGDQQPHDLALGDGKAEAAQLRDQPRHRHLSLMVLRENEAPQLGPEMSRGPDRKRRHDRSPVRRQPALAPIADHPRPDLQILHHIDLVALEARAGRNRRPDQAILDRDNPRLLAPTAPASADLRQLPRTRLLHAARLARLDHRSAFNPFSRTISSRNAAFSAVSAAIRAMASNNSFLRSATSKPSISGSRSPISAENHDLYPLANPKSSNRPAFCPSYILSEVEDT